MEADAYGAPLSPPRPSGKRVREADGMEQFDEMLGHLGSAMGEWRSKQLTQLAKDAEHEIRSQQRKLEKQAGERDHTSASKLQALTHEYHELKTCCKRFRVSAEELSDARGEQAAKVEKARDVLAAERKRHEQHLAVLYQKACADMGTSMQARTPPPDASARTRKRRTPAHAAARHCAGHRVEAGGDRPEAQGRAEEVLQGHLGDARRRGPEPCVLRLR